MNKELLGIVIGSVIMVTSLLSGNVIEEDSFTFVDSQDRIDVYPNGSSWGDFGTFDGTQNTTENTIITTNGNGSFISEDFQFNDSIRMSQLITESDNIGSGDKVVLFVEYLNEDGVTLNTQNFSMTQQLDTYELEDIERGYNGYRFTIDINQDQQGGDVEVEKVTFEYEIITDLSEELPFDLSDFVLIVPFLLGFLLFYLSFVGLVVGET